MKFWRKHWKRIEHWIVVLWIVMTVFGGAILNFWGPELGLLPPDSSDSPACYDAYGRC